MEKNIEELTLLLMYLTSWEEDGYVRDENDMIKEAKYKKCWKGYLFDVINKLTDEEYLYFSKGKSVSLTPKGEKFAKELIEKYIKEKGESIEELKKELDKYKRTVIKAMKTKYDFFIAGRNRNKENILKICELFDKYKISYYCFLKNEDNWGYGNKKQTQEEKQKEFELLDLKSDVVLNLFNQDLEAQKSSKNLLLVLPAGKAAHIESGISYGMGKKCYAIGEYEATDTLYNIFEEIFSSEKELEDFLKNYSISKKKDIDDETVNELIDVLKEPMEELNKMQLKQRNFVERDVDYIIKNNVKEEKRICKTFDMLLDLVYWYGEEMEEVYFRLINYYKSVNIDITNDYEKFYFEIIKEEEL